MHLCDVRGLGGLRKGYWVSGGRGAGRRAARGAGGCCGSDGEVQVVGWLSAVLCADGGGTSVGDQRVRWSEMGVGIWEGYKHTFMWESI